MRPEQRGAGPGAAYLWLGTACGFVWGLIGMLIAYPLLGSAAMGGFALAPASGWLLARAGWVWRLLQWPWHWVWAALALHLAAVLFGLGCGAHALLSGAAGRSALDVLSESVVQFTWGMTRAGWSLLLWPLCWATQVFLWRIGSRGQ